MVKKINSILRVFDHVSVRGCYRSEERSVLCSPGIPLTSPCFSFVIHKNSSSLGGNLPRIPSLLLSVRLPTVPVQAPSEQGSSRRLLTGFPAASMPQPNATLTPKNPNSSIPRPPPWLAAAEVRPQLLGLTVKATRLHSQPIHILGVAVKPTSSKSWPYLTSAMQRPHQRTGPRGQGRTREGAWQ